MVRRLTLLIAIASVACGIALQAAADSAWTQVTIGGQTLDVMAMDSAPPWISGLMLDSQRVDVLPQSATMLSGVPTSNWNYGCSATSAGMIFGYYDRNGYDNMWAGGIVPLYMGDMTFGTASTLIATPPHITDYWASAGSIGPDPWEKAGRSDHVWADCVADYMGTNQWKWDFDLNGAKDFNVDGGTALFAYNSAAKLVNYIPPASAGMPQTELCYGLRLFAESRGYTVLDNYTQKIDARYAGGFSFADYMGEIDRGDPVMIQVTGHSMVGVGYDAANSTVYLHDTWGDYTASMTWGEWYEDRQMQAVTVIDLAPLGEGAPGETPELPPGVLAVLGAALAALMCLQRQRRAAPACYMASRPQGRTRA